MKLEIGDKFRLDNGSDGTDVHEITDYLLIEDSMGKKLRDFIKSETDAYDVGDFDGVIFIKHVEVE